MNKQNTDSYEGTHSNMQWLPVRQAVRLWLTRNWKFRNIVSLVQLVIDGDMLKVGNTQSGIFNIVLITGSWAE